MKSYYERDGITIYHGDCREIMPQVVADCVVTDPPYGIDIVRGKLPSHQRKAPNQWCSRGYEPIHGDTEPFDPSLVLSLSLPTILWGANHYASRLSDQSCWIVWDKLDGFKHNVLSDCEMAWTNLGGPARLINHRWIGYMKASERGARYHPTQKPVAVMGWCLTMTEGSILDPYCGSGSTLVAALQVQRNAIGIEIEEQYCEVAAKRLGQRVLPL